MTAFEAYHAQLKALWNEDGRPSSRTISRRVNCSHTTVAEALKGQRLISQEMSRKLFVALGGLGVEADALWLRAQEEKLDNPTVTKGDFRKEVLRALSEVLGRLERLEGKLDAGDRGPEGARVEGERLGHLEPGEARVPGVLEGHGDRGPGDGRGGGSVGEGEHP